MSEDDRTTFYDAPEGDAPIVLGPPSLDDDPFGGDMGYAPPSDSGYGDFASAPADQGGYGDFASAPADQGGYDAFGSVPVEGDIAYLGDVNEAPSTMMMADDANAPIVLMARESVEEEAAPESNEPTPMQIWNNEWQELLRVRKDEENSCKSEMVEQARVELEAFQHEREQKREAAMAKNREDEQVKLEAIEADLENDNSWQRVCKMVELQHETTDKSEDVKRMRDVMILLKNEPTKAQALSG